MRTPTKPQFQRLQRVPARRGSIMLFYLMLLGTLLTGAVASMAILATTQTRSTGVSFDRNEAFFAAEAGIQQAIWNINHNSSSFLSSVNQWPTITLANGSTYTIQCTTSNPNWPTTPLTFQSVGQSADGNVTSQASVTVTSSGFCPGFAIGGNLEDNGNISVAGNVWVVGDAKKNGTMTITNGAGQSSCSFEMMGDFKSNGTYIIGSSTAPGNVMANGTITENGTNQVYGNVEAPVIEYNGNWNVTGTTTVANPNLDFTAPSFSDPSASIYVDVDGLINKADETVAPSTIGRTIDFTSIKNPNVPGNPVIVVTGNLSLTGSTTVKGSGTLVVEGSMSINGSFKGSNGPALCNIVTSEDSEADSNPDNLKINGTIDIQGALCINGSLNKNGSMTLVGPTILSNNLDGNGSMNMSYAAAPWFVHWTSDGGGSSNIKVSNFKGPMY